MKVAYNIGVDGWTKCVTARPCVTCGYGPIEISEAAWERLSKDGVIPCRIGLTDTEHLIEAAT